MQLKLFNLPETSSTSETSSTFLKVEDVAGAIVHQLAGLVRTKKDVILKSRRIVKEILNGVHTDESVKEDIEIKLIAHLDELPDGEFKPADFKNFLVRVISSLCLSYLGRSKSMCDRDGEMLIGNFTLPLFKRVVDYFRSLGLGEVEAEEVSIAYFESVASGESSTAFLRKVTDLLKLRRLQVH